MERSVLIFFVFVSLLAIFGLRLARGFAILFLVLPTILYRVSFSPIYLSVYLFVLFIVPSLFLDRWVAILDWLERPCPSSPYSAPMVPIPRMVACKHPLNCGLFAGYKISPTSVYLLALAAHDSFRASFIPFDQAMLLSRPSYDSPPPPHRRPFEKMLTDFLNMVVKQVQGQS